MDLTVEQHKISQIIRDTISALCKNGLTYNIGFMLEGVVKVFIDSEQPFLININDTVFAEGTYVGKDRNKTVQGYDQPETKRRKIGKLHFFNLRL